MKEFKPEDDTYFSPEEEDKKEAKANSEKLMKQPDLLASVPKNDESGRTTAADDSLVKDGKSFDNTNASLHDNELDKHTLAGMKSAKINLNEEPVNPVKLHINGDLGENDIYKERGLGFGEDNLSCHSENFHKNTEKIHELDEAKNLGLDDDHFGNNDLEMAFSDKIPHLDNDKAPELHDFERDYDIKPFGNDVDEFSHHSSILHNEFMERPSAELNYF